MSEPNEDYEDFTRTHWSLIDRVQSDHDEEAGEAFSELCRIYWKPVFTYIFFKKNRNFAEASDLTQEFFLNIMEKETVNVADKSRGRFRTFLKRVIDNFLINRHHYENRQKRGGGAFHIPIGLMDEEHLHIKELSTDVTPDQIFEESWATTLLNEVYTRLQQEHADSGDLDWYRAVEPMMLGDKPEKPVKELAAEYKLSIPAVYKRVKRLKQRFSDLLRDEVGKTLSDPSGVDEELGHMLASLGG